MEVFGGVALGWPSRWHQCQVHQGYQSREREKGMGGGGSSPATPVFKGTSSRSTVITQEAAETRKGMCICVFVCLCVSSPFSISRIKMVALKTSWYRRKKGTFADSRRHAREIAKWQLEPKSLQIIIVSYLNCVLFPSQQFTSVLPPSQKSFHFAPSISRSSFFTSLRSHHSLVVTLESRDVYCRW